MVEDLKINTISSGRRSESQIPLANRFIRRIDTKSFKYLSHVVQYRWSQ
jgi:hypothetical protein